MIYINPSILLLVLALVNPMMEIGKSNELLSDEIRNHVDMHQVIPGQKNDSLLAKVIAAATTEAMVEVNNNSEYGIAYGHRTLVPSEIEKLKKLLKGKSYEDQFGIHLEDETFQISTKTLRISYNSEIEFGPLLAFHVKNGQLAVLLINTTNQVLYTAPFDEASIDFDEIRTTLCEVYKKGIEREFAKFYKE